MDPMEGYELVYSCILYIGVPYGLLMLLPLHHHFLFSILAIQFYLILFDL